VVLRQPLPTSPLFLAPFSQTDFLVPSRCIHEFNISLPEAKNYNYKYNTNTNSLFCIYLTLKSKRQGTMCGNTYCIAFLALFEFYTWWGTSQRASQYIKFATAFLEVYYVHIK
jgi:hypothetical protein